MLFIALITSLIVVKLVLVLHSTVCSNMKVLPNYLHNSLVRDADGATFIVPARHPGRESGGLPSCFMWTSGCPVCVGVGVLRCSRKANVFSVDVGHQLVTNYVCDIYGWVLQGVQFREPQNGFFSFLKMIWFCRPHRTVTVGLTGGRVERQLLQV